MVTTQKLSMMAVILTVVLAHVFAETQVLPCKCANMSILPGGNYTIGSSNSTCMSLGVVDYSNVSIAGTNTIVTLDVSAFFDVKSLSPINSVTVSFKAINLRDGAVLIIRGGSLLMAPPSLARRNKRTPQLLVTIQSLQASNAALVFTRKFPPTTSIIVVDANMTSDDALSAPQLPYLDPYDPTYFKVFLLVDLSLTDESFLIVDRSNLGATATIASCQPIRITGSLYIANNSFLTLQNSAMSTSTNSVILFWYAIIFLGTNSSLSIQCNVLSSHEGNPFYFALSSLAIVSSSSFSIYGNQMECDGIDIGNIFLVSGTPINVSGSSVYSVRSNAFSGLQSNGALLFSNSPVFVTANSVFALQSNNLTSMSRSSSIMTIENSGISVSTSSMFIVQDNFIAGDTGGLVFSILSCTLQIFWSSLFVLQGNNMTRVRTTYTRDVLAFSRTTISVNANSSFIFQNNTLSGGAVSACAFIESSVAVGNQSSFSLRKNVMSSGAFWRDYATACLVFQYSPLTIRGKSTFIVEANVFSGGRDVSFALHASPLQLIASSVWIFAINQLLVTPDFVTNAYPPVVVDVDSPISVGEVTSGGSSWLVWANNIFFARYTPACVYFSATLTISSASGYATFTGNNCTAAPGGWMWLNATSRQQSIVVGGGVLYQGCTFLNGALNTSAGLPMPSTVVNGGLCGGVCDPSVYCYVILSSTCKLTATTGLAVCSCVNGEGGGGAETFCAPNVISPLPQRAPNISLACTPVGPLVPWNQREIYSGTSSPSMASSATSSVGGLTDTKILSSSISLSTSSSFSHTFSESEELWSSSASLTPSLSCFPGKPTAVSALASLILFPDAGSGSRISTDQLWESALNVSAIDVALVASARQAIVLVKALPGVVLIEASNPSASIGNAWGASVESARNVVRMTLTLIGSSVGELTFQKESQLIFSVNIAARGRCLPPDFRERVTFSWTLKPVPPPSNLQLTTSAAFRASTAACSILGAPVAVMTTTSMMSVMSLSDCLFSDVDPLDPSVAPVPVPLGDEMGQYYRGAIAVALGIYLGLAIGSLTTAAIMKHARSATSSLSMELAGLRMPSLGMVAVGLFGQGLASCAVSIIRLNRSGLDTILGCVALLVSALLVGWALFVTTRGLQCTTERRSQVSTGPRWLRRLMVLAQWNRHWKDTSADGFKKRYFILLDDLHRPWWTAAEMASNLVQGAVLGIRANSRDVCKDQEWILATCCVTSLIGAAWLRPCGARMSNAFLISSKAGAAAVAVCSLLHTLTLSETFTSTAQIVTSVSVGLASLQTAVLVMIMLVGWSSSIAILTRRVGRVFLRSNRVLDLTGGRIGRKNGAQNSDYDNRSEEGEGVGDVKYDASPLQSNTSVVLAYREDTAVRHERAMWRSLLGLQPSQKEEMWRRKHSRLVSVALHHLKAAMDPATPQSVRLQLLVQAACLPGSRREGKGLL